MSLTACLPISQLFGIVVCCLVIFTLQVDNRQSSEPVISPDQAVKLCDRNFGIGGDGVSATAAGHPRQHTQQQHMRAHTLALTEFSTSPRLLGSNVWVCCCLLCTVSISTTSTSSRSVHISKILLHHGVRHCSLCCAVTCRADTPPTPPQWWDRR